MGLLKEVKMICLEHDISLQELLKRYNDTYKTSILYNSFYRKFKDETIKHTEYVNIMKLLGYDVIIQKRKEGE